MPNETKIIVVPVYRDKEGNPTCASHFPSGEVCKFLRLVGLRDSPNCGVGAKSVQLYDKHGGDAGFIQPSDTCPLWTSSNAEFPLIGGQDLTK